MVAVDHGDSIRGIIFSGKGLGDAEHKAKHRGIRTSKQGGPRIFRRRSAQIGFVSQNLSLRELDLVSEKYAQ
jgi:hypothetical protein